MSYKIAKVQGGYITVPKAVILPFCHWAKLIDANDVNRLKYIQEYIILNVQLAFEDFITNCNELVASSCHISAAKPQVSLTAPNRNHFARVSLMVLDNFLDAIAKAKRLIRKSIAQNLKPVSLTKSFLALAMAFNLLLSNPT